MDRLGIEFLSVLGLPPMQFISAAAKLGCRHISITVHGLNLVPSLGYPDWSLKSDTRLRRQVTSALADHDVSISLGEGFLIQPGTDVSASASADLDVMAELGVPRINVVSLEPDLSRTFDQFGAVASLAAKRDIMTVTEFAPGMTISDLPTAVSAVEHVASPHFRILIDTMHLVYSGSTATDLAELNPDMIGYAQLSDTTLDIRREDYLNTAMYERLPPGDGELPLFDILSALPPTTVIGLEVPERSKAESGVSPIERMQPCVIAARDLLARVAAGH